MKLNEVHNLDALIGLAQIPSESVDLIIADPPYNIGKDFGNNSDKQEMNDYVQWCKQWMNECVRILKPTGSIYIYGFSEILAYLSVELELPKRWVIWHYTNKNVASLNSWQRSHESIIYAWKEKPLFNRDLVREPYTEGFLKGAAGKTRKATPGRFSTGLNATTYNAHEGGALPRDVIKIPALAGGAGKSERWFFCKTCDAVYKPQELKKHQEHDILKHPTQKPFDLTVKLIRASMPMSEGLVLIPFAGSGSECAAAKSEGYDFIGFELNSDYVTLAKGYIESIKPESKLF